MSDRSASSGSDSGSVMHGRHNALGELESYEPGLQHSSGSSGRECRRESHEVIRETHSVGMSLDALPWCASFLEELRPHSTGFTLTTLQTKACGCSRAPRTGDFLGSMPKSILASVVSDCLVG